MNSEDKSFLLDPDPLGENALPIFKPFSQLIHENLILIFSILVLLLLVGAYYFFFRRKAKEGNLDQNDERSDPYAEAINAISELQGHRPRLKPKPFIFKLSEILRIYVEKLFKFPAMELTGEEFLREVASHNFFKNRYESRLRDFVSRGDRIKYSPDTSDFQETENLLTIAIHFVNDTHTQLSQENLENSIKQKDSNEIA